jgi:hypothetical protein
MRVFDALCGLEWLRRFGLPLAVEGWGQGGVIALLAAALDPEVTTIDTFGMMLSWAEMYHSPLYTWHPSLVLPGVLRHGDLPDIAAGLAPRPLTLHQPIGADGQPADLGRARRAYGDCFETYVSGLALQALPGVQAFRVV